MSNSSAKPMTLPVPGLLNTKVEKGKEMQWLVTLTWLFSNFVSEWPDGFGKAGYNP